MRRGGGWAEGIALMIDRYFYPLIRCAMGEQVKKKFH